MKVQVSVPISCIECLGSSATSWVVLLSLKLYQWSLKDVNGMLYATMGIMSYSDMALQNSSHQLSTVNQTCG